MSAPHLALSSRQPWAWLIAHPDKGGSNERMAEINVAWEQFRKERGF